MKRIFSVILAVFLVSLPFFNTYAENNGFVKIEAIRGRVMALKEDGTVWVWGNNTNGIMGDGTNTARYAPVKIHGVENIVDIAMSDYHNALLVNDDTVWYWGVNADFLIDKGFPVYVPQKMDIGYWYLVNTQDTEAKDYKAFARNFNIYSGNAEEMFIKHDGTVWRSTYRRYFDDILGYVYTDKEIFELTEFFGARDLAIDGGSYYIICADGSIISKGENYAGQLGNGFSNNVSAPIKLDEIKNAKRAILTFSDYYPVEQNPHYYILSTDGTVSLLDYVNSQNRIFSVPIENVVDMVANDNIILALREDSTVWTWDINNTYFNVRMIEGLKDITGVFKAYGTNPLSYGVIDTSGNVYFDNLDSISDFLGGLVEYEHIENSSFNKVTKLKDNNESVQHLKFDITLDGTRNILDINSINCELPLKLIYSDGYFFKLLHESIGDLTHILEGGVSSYRFNIRKEGGEFIGYSEEIKPSITYNDNFFDIGNSFAVDNNRNLYYTGRITELNYKYFPPVPYGYQPEWKEIISSVISLKIGSDTILNNNIEIKTPAPPIIKNGRTIIPVREVVEGLGGNVSWDEETKTTHITFDENELYLPIGSFECSVNGETVTLDVAPEIINNKTYLPLRFVCENIGAIVYWEETANKITVTR